MRAFPEETDWLVSKREFQSHRLMSTSSFEHIYDFFMINILTVNHKGLCIAIFLINKLRISICCTETAPACVHLQIHVMCDQMLSILMWTSGLFWLHTCLFHCKHIQQSTRPWFFFFFFTLNDSYCLVACVTLPWRFFVLIRVMRRVAQYGGVLKLPLGGRTKRISCMDTSPSIFTRGKGLPSASPSLRAAAASASCRRGPPVED